MSISTSRSKKQIMILFSIFSFVVAMMGCDMGISSPEDDITTSESAESNDDNQSIGSTGSDEEINRSTIEKYTAITEDNVRIKLLRYRPAPDAPFNENRQPVV
jgi:hypothetical protein